jgi:hypothetical protein
MNWELLVILPAIMAAALYLLRFFLRTFSGKGTPCHCGSTSCSDLRSTEQPVEPAQK